MKAELNIQLNFQVNNDDSLGLPRDIVMAGDYEKIAELGRRSRANAAQISGDIAIEGRRYQQYRSRALTPRRR